MSARSHSVPLRGVALVLLLWVGLDVGARGLFASDFQPIAASAASGGGCTVRTGASDPCPDHCFCHGQSLGAALALPAVRPERTDTLVLAGPCRTLRSTARPLYHPPQILE